MQPDEPYYLPQAPDRSGEPHAIDLLIHQRPRILRVKLAVLAGEIQEGLRIRGKNAERISDELLVAGTHLLPFNEPRLGFPRPDEAVRQFWENPQAKLSAEARSQDVECWRDVAQLMNEFLITWEAVEQGAVRARFLTEQHEEDRE